MEKHIFYQRYANTPLSDRFTPIKFSEYGMMTLSDIYQKIKRIDEKLLNDEVERQHLLRAANEYYSLIN